MIKIKVIEEIEGDYAVFKRVVTFFGLPIYSIISKTTNSDVIAQFKVIKVKKIKGFKK